MVLDASAAVELLLNTPAGDRISSRLVVEPLLSGGDGRAFTVWGM